MMKLDERRARLRRKIMHRATRDVNKCMPHTVETWDALIKDIVQEAVTAVLFEDFLDELGDKVDGKREVSPTA